MECTIQIWVSNVINLSIDKDDDNICLCFSYKSYGYSLQIGKPKEHNKRRFHFKQTEICKFDNDFVKQTVNVLHFSNSKSCLMYHCVPLE